MLSLLSRCDKFHCCHSWCFALSSRIIELVFVRDDPVRVIREQLDRLRDEDTSGWSGPAQTDRAVQLTQLAAEVEAVTAPAVGTWVASGAWMAGGSRSPVNALAWRSGRPRHVAARLVALGRVVHDHDQTAKALMSGELPVDHAFTLARALTKDRAELYPDYEADFLDKAKQFDHRRFKILVETWCEVVDDMLGKTNEADAFEKRGIKVSQMMDGVSDIEGTAEPYGAALLHKVFEVFDVADDPTTPGGARNPRQRRYDALIAALEAALVSPNADRATFTRAFMDVIVSYEVLQGRQPATLDNLRSEIVGVGVVPPSLLRRLAADSAMGRIIATAAGLPLDVGRQVRFFNRAHRRAIRFRDGSCVWPGCDLPGEWCDADHALDYSKKGKTAVTNGRFLCRRHHHLRDKGWCVEYDPASGRCSVTSPLGLTYHSGPDPPV